jgi:hypothetical protein
MRKSQSNDETDAPKPRDRHGERSVPPPLEFDLFKLPDSTLITSRDVAAAGRWAVSTVETWRQRPKHPLKWMSLPGGQRRTTVGDLKQFLATGKPRKFKREPPATNEAAAQSSKPRDRKPQVARKPSRRPRPAPHPDSAEPGLPRPCPESAAFKRERSEARDG